MRSVRPILVAVAVAGAACASPAPPRDRGPPTPGSLSPVSRVTDGDTIHVLLQGRDQRVRLIGVDTPEVPWYGGRGECYGAEAARYARQRLQGRTVRLSFDRELWDGYGRLLAYVFLGGELFNLTLVRLGYASADPVPPDTRMAGVFAGAQAGARRARRGMWSRCPG